MAVSGSRFKWTEVVLLVTVTRDVQGSVYMLLSQVTHAAIARNFPGSIAEPRL